MSLPLLALLYMASQESTTSRAAAKKKAQPKWPSTKHAPVPKMAPMPPMPHEKTPAHATPAKHVQHEEQHHEAPVHAPHTSAAHHDSATPLHELHHEPVHASAHVEQHHAPAPAKPRVVTLPPQVIHARPVAKRPVAARPAADPGNKSVADVQRILVGLGWRGKLTTSGPLHNELKDGEFGPVTVADWQQSAHKRGLDTTITRVGPNTAHVNPATYAKLKQVAISMGAVVVGRIP